MADRFSKSVRSRIMASVKGKDTKPEIKLRKILFSKSLRYRKNYRIGSKIADIAFTRNKVAVFVDGCFWHGCPTCYVEPKSNKGYWIPKIRNNKIRDRKGTTELKGLGWKVVRVWEHEITYNSESVSNKLAKIIIS